MPRNKRRKKRPQQVPPVALQRSPEQLPSNLNSAPLARPTAQAKVRSQRFTQMEFYQGVLPHPEHMERMEALHPGVTDRIIAMAEGQGQHRQAMERKFLNFNGSTQVLGVVFAGLIGLLSVGGAIYLLVIGKPLREFAAALVPVAGIVSAFFVTRKRQSSERAQKR